MSNLVARIHRKIRAKLAGHILRFDEYAALPDPKMKENLKSKAADVFFSNEGSIVHKWLHYLPIYDQLLTPYIGSDVRFLEIGVSRGGSLRLWRRLLGPKATIFGVDVDPACARYDGESACVRIGSQADAKFLRTVVQEMGGVDLVLDDGSHFSSHQQISFETLFPLLPEGGLYIIEDMHTAYWPGYEGGLRYPGTAIELLKDKVDAMHEHYFQPDSRVRPEGKQIESIQFFDSIAAVRKKQQLPRRHVRVGHV